MRVALTTIGLLTCSNVFMTFAWYAHLKDLRAKPWYLAALVSWGIALFEYLLQVPANRIGYTTLSLSQLKIVQEVITLSVFVPFSILYMRQPFRLDFLWAGLTSRSAPFACSARDIEPWTHPEPWRTLGRASASCTRTSPRAGKMTAHEMLWPH